MNRLSKIAIISSLSIFGALTTVSGLILAQEDTATPIQEIPVESKDRRTPIRDSLSGQRQDNQKVSPQSKSVNRGVIESEPSQRVTNQDNRPSSQPALTPEQREQKIRERCELITNRISQHKEQFQIRSQSRLDIYNVLLTRLESISQRLSDKGVEVTQYNRYLDELVGKINELDMSIQEYIQGLGSEEALICSNQKPTESIDKRRDALKSIISQEREIRVYIKDTIILYLRSVNPQTTAPDSSLSTPSTNNNQVLPQ